MANSYVHEDQRKRRYVTRAVTYYAQRITEPMWDKPKEFRSISKLSKTLGLSNYQVRMFVVSKKDSTYLRSKEDNILYLLTRPKKDVAITARVADPNSGAPLEQEFTSGYQLVKRFCVSYQTVYEMKNMQPLGVECEKPINDEFKRKYYLTFHK